MPRKLASILAAGLGLPIVVGCSAPDPQQEVSYSYTVEIPTATSQSTALTQLKEKPKVSTLFVFKNEDDEDEKEVAGLAVKGVTLEEIVSGFASRVYGDELRYRGLEKLPAGYFEFTVADLPQSKLEVFETLRKLIRENYGLKMEVKEAQWNGYFVDLPPQWRNGFTYEGPKERSYGDSQGHLFAGSGSLSSFFESLEERLEVPIETGYYEQNARWEMELRLKDGDVKTFLSWMRSVGFMIEPREIARETLVVSTAK